MNRDMGGTRLTLYKKVNLVPRVRTPVSSDISNELCRTMLPGV